ncbi:MAG TPA: alkaline phytoceramidase [Vicinamibacteria bacterium]|nr:alkaline phytoceramidase [Vicinamibacteria bacterium]
MGMVFEERSTGSDRARYVWILVALGCAAFALWSRPAIPQNPAYHLMADQRPALGVSNGLNVVSNVPFALVGGLGLVATLRRRDDGSPVFEEPWLRWPYALLFLGTAVTALGSSYYHLAPDNARLVWDRLPMTLVCMGLVTAVLAECVDVRLARQLFLPLVVAAAGSVGYWRWTELHGVGDLRPYALAQYGSLLAIVLLLALYPGRFREARYLAAGLCAYGVAKILELADAPVYAASGHIVSGHTLKHLVAAGGLAMIAAMIHKRGAAPIEAPQPRE